MLKSFICVLSAALFALAVVVALTMTALSAQGEEVSAPSEFVYFHEKLMIDSQVSPILDGEAMTVTEEIEGKSVWVSDIQVGMHSVNGVTISVESLLPGQTLDMDGFNVTANPEPWGKVGVVRYATSVSGSLYTLSGYGFVFTPEAQNLLYWNGTNWDQNPSLGYYTMVFVPVEVPTPTPTIVPTTGFSLFLPALYKAPTACVGSNPIEPFGVFGSDGLGFDLEVKIGDKVSTKFALTSGDYTVEPMGCFGAVYNMRLGQAKIGEKYIDNVVSFNPHGSDLYLVAYPGSIYVLNGSGYDTALDWGKYGIEFWTGSSWASTPNWSEITTIRIVTK